MRKKLTKYRFIKDGSDTEIWPESVLQHYSKFFVYCMYCNLTASINSKGVETFHVQQLFILQTSFSSLCSLTKEVKPATASGV